MADGPLLTSEVRIPDATYLLDRFSRIQYVRGAGASVVRVGADLFETIPEFQRESVRECLNAVRESGDSGRFDTLLHSNLNEPVHWEHRVVAVREHGEVNGFLIFATNLTRVLEVAMEREAFFEAAPEVFCVVNMDGRIRDLNNACCELLGGSREQLIGMPLVNYVSQDDSHRLRETMTTVMGHRRPSASLLVRHIGRSMPVNWAMSVSDRSDSVMLVATTPGAAETTGQSERVGSSHFERDALESSLTEESLSDDKHIGRVPSDRVPQETPDPLTSNETARDPQSQRETGSDMSQPREVVTGQNDHSIQKPADPIPLTASLTHALAPVTESTEPTDPTNQAGPEIADLYVQEFNSRLMSIMTNVELGRLSEDPGRVRRYLSQIEQEAQRASEMTRKMVSWRDEPARNRDSVPDERHFVRTTQRTVLIAEDDELVSDVVVKILEQASYRVLVCRNGKEAVEMCRRHDDIDLILLDVVMPVMSGPEAASQITLLRPEIPVLFTSGFVGDSLTSANIPSGAPLLKKPYQTDALLKVIEEHIGPAQNTVDSEGTSGL
ncbi:MAG: response regulator [Pseudomonadota bacterium]